MNFKPRNLVVCQTFDDFARATEEIDYNVEDLCVYCVENVTNYYWLNIESVWGQIGFIWDVYENKGHFSTGMIINWSVLPRVPDPQRLLSFDNLFSIAGGTGNIEFLDSGFSHIHKIGDWGTAASLVKFHNENLTITEIENRYTQLYPYAPLDDLVTLTIAAEQYDEEGQLIAGGENFNILIDDNNKGLNIDLQSINNKTARFNITYQGTSNWVEENIFVDKDNYQNTDDNILNNILHVDSCEEITLKFHNGTTITGESISMTPINLSVESISTTKKLIIDATGTNGKVKDFLAELPTSPTYKEAFDEIQLIGVNTICYWEPFMVRDEWPVFTPQITHGNPACIVDDETGDGIEGTVFYGNVINVDHKCSYTFDLAGVEYWSFFRSSYINLTLTNVIGIDDIDTFAIDESYDVIYFSKQYYVGSGTGPYSPLTLYRRVFNILPTLNNIDCNELDFKAQKATVTINGSEYSDGYHYIKTNLDTIKIKNITFPIYVNKNIECCKFSSALVYNKDTLKIKLIKNEGYNNSIGSISYLPVYDNAVSRDSRTNILFDWREVFDLTDFTDVNDMINNGITMISYITSAAITNVTTGFSTSICINIYEQPCVLLGGDITIVNYIDSVRTADRQYLYMIDMNKILAIKNCSIDISLGYKFNTSEKTAANFETWDDTTNAEGFATFFNKFIFDEDVEPNTYTIRVNSEQYALMTEEQKAAFIAGGYEIVEVQIQDN